MEELYFDGRKYVSSKRASVLTGYAKDYVGQLAREGRVDARLVGRNWYVLESALLEHKENRGAETRAEQDPAELKEALKAELRAKLSGIPEVKETRERILATNITYLAEEERPLMPQPVRTYSESALRTEDAENLVEDEEKEDVEDLLEEHFEEDHLVHVGAEFTRSSRHEELASPHVLSLTNDHEVSEEEEPEAEQVENYQDVRVDMEEDEQDTFATPYQRPYAQQRARRGGGVIRVFAGAVVVAAAFFVLIGLERVDTYVTDVTQPAAAGLGYRVRSFGEIQQDLGGLLCKLRSAESCN